VSEQWLELAHPSNPARHVLAHSLTAYILRTYCVPIVAQLLGAHYAAAGDGGGAGPGRGAVEATLQEAMTMLRCRRTPRPVPDHYCCKISMELMLEPVRCYTPLAHARAGALLHALSSC